MDEIDLSGAQYGDAVTVRGTIVELRGPVLVCIGVFGELVWVERKDIATHIPRSRPLTVGDRVRRRNAHRHVGAIVALNEDVVWVRIDGALYYTWSLIDVERVATDAS